MRSMRARTLVWTALGTFAAGCASEPAVVQPPPARAPAPPSHLAALERSMTGVFSSAAQAAADPSNFRDVRLVTTRIWPERTDGLWLYVEQALISDLAHPYRQRVYHVSERPDGTLVSCVNALPGNAQRFADGSGRPRHIDELTPALLAERDGCEVVIRPDGKGFVGRTEGAGCPSDLRGATYATSEMRITRDEIVSWDRGFDSAGRQVWGATKGGYIFRRVSLRASAAD